MIDSRRLPERGGVSVIEHVLARCLEERRPRFVLADGFRAHGVGRAPGLDPDLSSAVVSFAGLLERGAAHLSAARSAYRESCRQAAVQARELAAFAALRPAAMLDRPDDEVGAAAVASRAARPAALTAVSEWAVDEVMAALGMSSAAAAQLLAESVTLVERLPGTLAALEHGVIGPPHTRMLVEVLAPVRDEVRGEVEARLLARAAGRTVPQLRSAAQRAVLRADAAAAAWRAATAIRDRSVRAFPGTDGMGTLAATMPVPVLNACRDALRRYAQGCAVPDDRRTLDQRMVDCLADLILRPGETGLPPVQAQLTVVAAVTTLAGGDEPGEVDGQPVPAAMVRELAYALGLLPRPDATHDDAPADPDVQEAADPDTDLARGESTATQPARLLNLRTIAGTALAHLPRIAICDELSGQLLALTTAAGIRRAATCGHPACRTGATPCTYPPAGPGLGPPADTAGYRPADPLAGFVRARDRRCRFPGCRAAAVRCDLDHAMPWPAGPTNADNLCCLCRDHHRLSHQAPGWRMRLLPDGHPPPQPPEPPPPLTTLRGRVLGRPHRAGDEPAPF